MLWRDGGAFLQGAGSVALYAGDRLARRGDVVVVTLNYRIDALERHPTHRPPLKSPIRVNALSSVVEALRGRPRHASRARELRKSLCSARVRRKSVTRTGELD